MSSRHILLRGILTIDTMLKLLGEFDGHGHGNVTCEPTFNQSLVWIFKLFICKFYLLFAIFPGVEDVRLGEEFQRHGEGHTLSGTQMPQDPGTDQCRFRICLLQFKISGKCQRTVHMTLVTW